MSNSSGFKRMSQQIPQDWQSWIVVPPTEYGDYGADLRTSFLAFIHVLEQTDHSHRVGLSQFDQSLQERSSKTSRPRTS
jgi:hypothetical protein